MLCISSRLKMCIMLSLLLLLPGCKAKVDITIDNTSFAKEETIFTDSDKENFDVKNGLLNSTPRQYLETDLKWPTPTFYDAATNPLEPSKIDGVSYYKKTDLSTENELKEKYLYYFNLSNYQKSTLLNKCYKAKVNITKNVIQVKTSKILNCFEDYPMLDEIDVNVYSKCNIMSSNADKKTNNKLTWNITKDNYDKKNISFALDCSKKVTNVNNSYLICAYLAYMVVILIVILLFKAVFKHKNKIN